MGVLQCLLLLCLLCGVVSAREVTLSARLNGKIDLPCRLPESTGSGVIVRWFSKKNSWLSSGTVVQKFQDRMSIEKPGPNEWNLRITKLDVSFTDTYVCHADNNITVITVNLVIESPPKIDDGLSTPRVYTVKENATAELRCISSGTPEPVIQWYRGSEKKPINVFGSKLIIRKVRRYASDSYTCSAKNKIGEDTKTFNLSVKFEPELSVLAPVVYAEFAKPASLACVVQGSPINDLFWTDKRGDRINPNWKYIVVEEDSGNGVPVKFTNLVFRPNIISVHEFGNYKCHAVGENTRVEKVIRLEEKKTKTEDGQPIIEY